MQSGEIKELLAVVLDITLNAGKIVREHNSRKVEVFHKGPTDLVTETDLAVEKFLHTELLRLDKNIAFMGEESFGSDKKPESPVGLTWIVDPVDGTTNYAHKGPFVATSIGLWDGRKMLMGVVNCPLMDECFWAGRGIGAFSGDSFYTNGRLDNVDFLRVSAATSLEKSLIAMGFPYEIRERLPLVLDRLEKVLPVTQGARRCGAAAIDLAYVAAGRFDGYYEEWIKPWDTSAGWLLVEEAGGAVCSIDGREYGLASSGIIATNGLIHEELVTLLVD